MWSPLQPLDQFAPDADPTLAGTLLDVANVIPSERGWRSAYSLADGGVGSLSATCCGSYLLIRQNGSPLIFAGTATKLYLQSGTGWTDIGESGINYHALEEQRWRWASMGDYVLAANQSDTIAVSLAGATFSSITSAPKAKLIESVYGFIMAASTIDATYGTQPDRWWCSGIFDHTDWTPAATTQCTTGRIVDTAGPITGLKRLGQNVVAYKESSLYLGEYVEPPTVWRWTLQSSNVGCASHDAVVNIGRMHLFMGSDNFYAYDGTQLTPIGSQVRKWFFDTELARNHDMRVLGVHDAPKTLVYWFYPSTAGTGTIDRALVYNYRLDRWGLATYAIESASDYSLEITYDSLGNYFSTYDAGIDRTYDSPAWLPGNVVPSVITSSHRLATIDGVSGSSSFTTWHMGDDAQYSLLRRLRVRWLTKPTEARAELYTRAEHGTPFTLKKAAHESNNKFDLLWSSRWHQCKVLTTGDCEFSGVAVDIVPQGEW